MQRSQSGFSTLPVLILAIIGLTISYSLISLLSYGFRSNSHSALKTERTNNALLLLPLMDCTNTLQSMVSDATYPVPNLNSVPSGTLATYCGTGVTTLNTAYMLRLKNYGTTNLDIGSYDVNARRSLVGPFWYRVACSIVPGTPPRRCLAVHEGIPVGSGFRNDALYSNQAFNWVPAFNLPYCCDNSPTNPSTPSTPTP